MLILNLNFDFRHPLLRWEFVVRKTDLKLNDALPAMEVNPETYEVRADGELLKCDPAEVLPLAQRYFLF